VCDRLQVLLAILLWSSTASARAGSPHLVSEDPQNIAFCQLAKDPAAYDGKLIRLTSFVTHGFENFQLADPSCPLGDSLHVWVTYGGTEQSHTIYCCPGEGAKESRPRPLVVQGIEIPLERDSVFDRFTQLLERERGTTVRVTLVGRFFAGIRQERNGQTFWTGYGHFGAFSLFVIQRVEFFEPHLRRDVDYGVGEGPDEPEGCRPRSVRYLRTVSITFELEFAQQAVQEQRQADDGDRAWAFTDSERVALDALRSVDAEEHPVLRRVKKTPTRVVYRWRKGNRETTVIVVRPYWLSFYSKTPSVVWVATEVKEAQCE